MPTTLAGTDDGLHLLVTGRPSRVDLAGHEITAVARDGAAWWAITGGQEAWRSEGRGKWARQATAPEDVRLNCLARTPAGLLVGTSDARLFRLRAEALEPVDSFDQVDEREKWYTPWGGPPDSRSIAVDPAGAIYVNVHVGGIVRSTDGGQTWQPTIDIDSDVHQVIAVDGRPGVVLAATAQGLAASDDSGDTWTFHTDGLHGSYCRAVAVAGQTLLVSASEGHRGRRAALYRRPLGSTEPFERCERGLPGWFGSNIDTHCLAGAGPAVAFGTEDGDMYRSEDAGETWETIATGLPPVRCVAFE
jgi:photosystem II stability/assembly factor-like uncharacterized protein